MAEIRYYAWAGTAMYDIVRQEKLTFGYRLLYVDIDLVPGNRHAAQWLFKQAMVQQNGGRWVTRG